MKKVFLILSSIAIVGFCFAQTNYGLKAGVNLSKLKVRDNGQSGSNSYKAGFNGGVFAQIPLGRKFFLQPELQYDQMKSGTDNGSISLNYLSVPVTFKLKTAGGFSIYTGPQIGLLLSAKAKDNKGISEDLTKLFESSSFSWIVGAGIDLPYNISLLARYQFTAGSVTKTNDIAPGLRLPEMNLSAINIAVAYTLKK